MAYLLLCSDDAGLRSMRESRWSLNSFSAALDHDSVVTDIEHCIREKKCVLFTNSFLTLELFF